MINYWMRFALYIMILFTFVIAGDICVLIFISFMLMFAEINFLYDNLLIELKIKAMREEYNG